MERSCILGIDWFLEVVSTSLSKLKFDPWNLENQIVLEHISKLKRKPMRQYNFIQYNFERHNWLFKDNLTF